jgi:ornithine--oxo-acid transaminase
LFDRTRRIAETLLLRGILSEETHGTAIGLAAPLDITRAQINWAIAEFSLVVLESER